MPTKHSVDIAVKSPSPTMEVESEPIARFQVSSRHLALASPVFKDMIHSEDEKSHMFREQSFAQVPLADDDPGALLVLLRLLHNQHRLVPRKVDLWMLTKIAILVDKYELLEVTHLLASDWLSSVKETIPPKLNENLLP